MALTYFVSLKLISLPIKISPVSISPRSGSGYNFLVGTNMVQRHVQSEDFTSSLNTISILTGFTVRQELYTEDKEDPIRFLKLMVKRCTFSGDRRTTAVLEHHFGR